MTEQVVAELAALVRDRLARGGEAVTPHLVAETLRADGRPVGDATVLEVHRRVQAEVVGAGALQGLLAEPGVTDVLVNGPGAAWIDRGRGLERRSVELADDAAVRRLAQRLAALGGRRLDDATPMVDVRLPDGTRCHAVLHPVARTGTTISLRVPRPAGWSIEALAEHGALVPDAVALVRRVVAARAAFLVSGGTGAGKTSLLSAMLAAVAPEERLVVVEDSGELEPRHPHVVALEARTANIEGGGVVSLQTLVRQALRMRPDRVVVGEVRGAEVVDLLAALNTGHEGGCGTVHANSAAAVPARLEALGMTAGLGREALHSQLGSALDLVLHVTRDRGTGRRRLAEVAVLRKDGAFVHTETAVRFAADGRVAEGPGLDRMAALLEAR
ncbi:TadA family conjugal transfer-associated ATPase [Nocardioides daejeonensis]|uniref:TadA family conjugal transfer-associated ATPase n=1 Tax=Nocardioides daejeonensis TaxID=1046556 RepID=UPI000D750B8A|nr:TadA family conjugal transfer-associated ATPase [Nocardioides daejeonensis]